MRPIAMKKRPGPIPSSGPRTKDVGQLKVKGTAMKQPPTTISRRTYLKTAAAGVAACAVGSGFAANSKLQHACIGVGGMMGGGNLGSFLAQPRAVVAAICDVD